MGMRDPSYTTMGSINMYRGITADTASFGINLRDPSFGETGIFRISYGGEAMFGRQLSLSSTDGVLYDTYGSLVLRGDNNPGSLAVIRGDLNVFSEELLGRVEFGSIDPSTNVSAGIRGYAEATFSTTDRATRISFWVTPAASTTQAEAGRFTPAGEFWVQNVADQGTYNIQCGGTGVWGAGAYVNGSDERLKRNISPLESSIDVVKALNPVTFQYRPEYSNDTSTQTGFIAQDLQIAMSGKSYLDGVVQAGPVYLNVAYQNILPIVTKALQEAITRIEQLEARVAQLENV
jgi:hypothetical protein